MDRPTLEVADIFRRYGDADREEAGPWLSTGQRRVMTAIETCRTAALGGHVEHVRFQYTGSRAQHHQKTMTLTAAEFIRRFLLHVLPAGFHRIRSDGFLGNRHRAPKLARCRQLLGTTRRSRHSRTRCPPRTIATAPSRSRASPRGSASPVTRVT